MVLPSERSSTAHAHGPARISSLRQVTSTDDRHEPDFISDQGYLPASSPPAMQSTMLVDEKILTLGTYEGYSTNGTALVDLTAFPQNTIGIGSLVTISPIPDSEADPSQHERNEHMLPGQRYANGVVRPLFVVESMPPEIQAQSSNVQVSIPSNEASKYGLKPQTSVLVATVNPKHHQASHMEIAFRDEYLSRSDMWRLVVSELAGKIVHKGQRITFLGSIKVSIKTIYIRGQRVSSAWFSASTKPVFRSESARYVLFIQMSKEMWDFDTDGTGEIMFDKVINGFLPDLFKRWQQTNARHLVTIVMFTRLEFQQKFSTASIASGARVMAQRSCTDWSSRDFYRVVVSDMPSGEWSDILLQLKKEFKVFLRDVSVRETNTGDALNKGNDSSPSADKMPSQEVTGHPCSALHGNILEAVNLASSQFSCDYIDRDLVRTGVTVIVITPGTGLFVVDYDLLAITTDNLIENGVGIDLVCLSRLPLHSVPLFKYRPSRMSRPKECTIDDDGSQEPTCSWRNCQNEQVRVPPNNAIYKSLGSSFQSTSGASDRQWDYGIPHWIDVSFWTSSAEGNRNPSIPSRAKGRNGLASSQLRSKSFVPRARMYELQMMGVTENSINQIRLPRLSKLRSNLDAGSAFPGLSIATEGKHSLHHGRKMYGPETEAGIPSSWSSLTSKTNSDTAYQNTQYQWMDDYDQTVFRDPRDRQKIENRDHKSSISSVVPDKNQLSHDRALDAGTSYPPNTTLWSSVRDSAGSGHFHRAMKERAPLRTKSGRAPTQAATPLTGSSIPNSKPPKLPRQISLGFRGFGAGTAKATASTEVTVEHARSAATINRQHQAPGISKATGFPTSAARVDKPREGSSFPFPDNDQLPLQSSSNAADPARPISIRNPTEIRIVSNDQSSEPRSFTTSTTLVSRNDEASKPRGSRDRPDIAQRPVATSSGDREMSQMTPKTAMAPWLTVINPSNPNKMDANSSSRLGRWQHIFPKKLRASKIKWKSLCSPASIPLTTEGFPSADELVLDYESSRYKVDLPVDDELLEQPRSRNWLIREMVAFRFSQGFQVVVGSRLSHSLYLPRFEDFNVFDDHVLAATDTTIVMTRGSTVHKISSAEAGHVEVECLTRRSVATEFTAYKSNESQKMYKPMIRTMLAERYDMQCISITPEQRQPDWSLVDFYIAGHRKQETDQKDDSLRSWRTRLVLIPVNVIASSRRPLQGLNQDNEEELRIEGIRKLTQLWQRFRHVPSSERRFQATSRKRKDTNPLDIMYQTRNPSAVVWAEKDNLGEDISTDKPVQLLPESELFQRANLNIQTLAQVIQSDKGVRLMDRRWHLRLHYNCFIGFELTSWLLQNFRDVDTRQEAVELGNELMDNGLFQHVQQRHNFRDGNYFYHIASEHLAARPESRSTWFGSRKADKPIPPTPTTEALPNDLPKAPGSRASSTGERSDDGVQTPTANRHQLGVALGKSLLYDVDHRKRSYRPEFVSLHYDRIHNPDNCYHIRIDWMNVTAKLIGDAIVSWAAAVERFGLKLVEIPLAEASTITSMHPFRAPALVKLAKSPPPEQPQTYLDATSFTLQTRAEKYFYQVAIMKKFDFVLDFEAASAFPADVDVTYSWGKPDYKYSQYIHRSGTLLAQITDEGDFLLLANRLYNNRGSSGAQEGSRAAEEAQDKFATPRSSHRGTSSSPHASPYSSPLLRAAVTTTTTTTTTPSPSPASPLSNPPPPTSTTIRKPPSSVFALPSQIKARFEAFCADGPALERFYEEAVSKASTPSTPRVGAGTPRTPVGGLRGMGMGMVVGDREIPALGLPESAVVGRERSPGRERGRV
ncbi:MAG: hypothetical protein LQ350_004418 [Teloschistes chrysophthalmus]|nr:MAG: hypothetical protein LQ350_004418 [Niorma chrysophthalma]